MYLTYENINNYLEKECLRGDGGVGVGGGERVVPVKIASLRFWLKFERFFFASPIRKKRCGKCGKEIFLCTFFLPKKNE